MLSYGWRFTDRRAVFVGEADYKAPGGRIGGDLFADVTTFGDPAILNAVFFRQADPDHRRLPRRAWLEMGRGDHRQLHQYQFHQDRKFGKVYPVEGELTEDEAERYDELAELANGDALDEEGTTELDALQTKRNRDFTAEQRTAAGVVIYVTSDGSLKIEAAADFTSSNISCATARPAASGTGWDASHTTIRSVGTPWP
jgi:ParB family chromosome partitioning protein